MANFTSVKKRYPRRGSLDNGDSSESPKKSIYETQKEWLERRNEKVLQMQMDNADRELMDGENYSFVPKINKRSSKKIKMDFFERQEMYRKKKLRNIKKLNRSVDSYSYQPRINQNTSKLIKTNKKRKEFMAAQLAELDPDDGYHAMQTYVHDQKKATHKNKLSQDPKIIKENLKAKFNSVM